MTPQELIARRIVKEIMHDISYKLSTKVFISLTLFQQKKEALVLLLVFSLKCTTVKLKGPNKYDLKP